MLTIKTTGATAAAAKSTIKPMFVAEGETLAAAMLLFLLPIRRRRWQSLLGVLLLVFFVTALSGCGGTNVPVNTGGSTGTTPGNYTVTVTGTGGTVTATSTVSFTVQ